MDIAVSIGGILIGGIFIIASFILPYPSKIFPLFVSCAMVLLSTLVLGKALISQVSLDKSTGKSMPTKKALTLCFMAFLYVVLINILGFYSSSILSILVIGTWISREHRTKRDFFLTVIAACIFIGTVYFVFSYLIKSPIPSGWLF